MVKEGNYPKPKGLLLKDKLKIIWGAKIAKLLHQAGFSWKSIGRSKIGRQALIAQGEVIASTLHPNKIKNPLKIYFLTMLGGQTHDLAVEITLAFGLKAKGHKVTFILNDQYLPITEEFKNGQENRWELLSARSYFFGLRALQKMGFHVITLSQVIDKNMKLDIEEFNDIIDASILKHYKVGIIDSSLPHLEERIELVKESINYTSQIGNFIVRQNPDRVIMSHGIYATWGPPFRILKKANIPIITYSHTKRKKSLKFNWNETADWWDVGEEWEKVKNIPLNKEQQKKINRYLQSRITHEEDVLIYNFGKLEDRMRTIERFSLDPTKITYSLFTNVLWDAASTQREIVFNNPVEWVLETIKWFNNHPDKQLIVKIHPAEVVISTNQPFAQIIKKYIPVLPSNVKVIEPHEEVNSWSIYDVTDLGIIHTTTVGMELPLKGIPCIVVSKTHFRGKGFTIDITTKEEYFDYLKTFSPENIRVEEIKYLSKNYAYLLFERYQMPFDMLDEIKWSDVRSFNYNSIDELFRNEDYLYIIESIEKKAPFLMNEIT